MFISRKGVSDGVQGGAAVKKSALMRCRIWGGGRKDGAGTGADLPPQECSRGVKTTGIGSSLCLPALLGWACSEMLLSPSRPGEERSAKGALCHVKRMADTFSWRTLQGKAWGTWHSDDPCGPSLQARAGKNTDAPEKRKKPPEGGFVYPVKRVRSSGASGASSRPASAPGRPGCCGAWLP